MIKGIGIDIVEVGRIKKAIEKNDRFLSRLFTDCEISLYMSKGSKFTTIAGSFASKEAVSKALGTGFRNIKWKDIEILNDKMGKPYVKLHNNAKDIAYSQDISEILITISHTRYNAVAQAIATSTRIDWTKLSTPPCIIKLKQESPYLLKKGFEHEKKRKNIRA